MFAILAVGACGRSGFDGELQGDRAVNNDDASGGTIHVDAASDDAGPLPPMATLPAEDAPGPRFGHLAAWTGQRFLVWGGRTGSSFDCNEGTGDESPTGALLDPATGEWTVMPTDGAPGLRQKTPALWTGSELLVWGGCRFWQNSVGDGARFDPESMGWTPMSSVGAPSPRGAHIAVWTGNRMLVWGGHEGDNDRPLANGGIYDPATDSWAPMATLNAPPATHHAAAVWTGTELVVWGGQTVWNDASALNSGGVYNLATDTWRSMSTVGAPPAESRHTMAWTGSEVLTFGRRGAASYDPAADTWSPLPTTPGLRHSHSGVWTGNSFLIAGGCCTGANGAHSYDPVTGQWTELVVNEAGLARYGHASAWTGDALFVWGGADAATGDLRSDGFVLRPGQF